MDGEPGRIFQHLVIWLICLPGNNSILFVIFLINNSFIQLIFISWILDLMSDPENEAINLTDKNHTPVAETDNTKVNKKGG